MPPSAEGGGMEKVHISATCLSLNPNMTNKWTLRDARAPGAVREQGQQG